MAHGVCAVCSCRALRATVWRQLLDVHEAHGLRHQWGGSHSNKTLLGSLGIDTRNIVSQTPPARPSVLVLLMGTPTPHPGTRSSTWGAPELTQDLLCYGIIVLHNAFSSAAFIDHGLPLIFTLIMVCHSSLRCNPVGQY